MKKVIAFDIGGTNTRIALINEKFVIEKEEIIPTRRDNVEVFLSSLDELIQKFDLKDVIAFGVGIPGVCNRETGYIYDLPNVHIKDIPLGEFIESKYHKKVFVRNDAEVACLAEAVLGAGKDFDRTFFITISTGLGGALAVDQVNQDYITEIGHTAYEYKGKMNEYEGLASGTGLPKLAKLNGLDVKDSKELFALIKAKDPRALNVYNDWLMILSDFIHMIENSYYPDVICVTGGVMKEKDIFFEDLKALCPESNIVECHFKEEAGRIGAAVYAFKMMKAI